MSAILFKTKNEKQEAMIDLLTSEKKGSLTNGILLALEQFFSPENIEKYPDELYEDILDEEVHSALLKGEDIVSLALRFSEGKRVLAFREKKKREREERKSKIKRLRGEEMTEVYEE